MANFKKEIDYLMLQVKIEYDLDSVNEAKNFVKKHKISEYNNLGVKPFEEIKKELDEKLLKSEIKNKVKSNDLEIAKEEIELCYSVSRFIIENQTTIKETCEQLKISEYKLRKIKDNLKILNEDLYNQVQDVAKNNQKVNIIQKSEPKKLKNTDYVINDLDKKIEKLKPAFEVIEEFVKNYDTYYSLFDECITKADLTRDEENHQIENRYLTDEDFDCCCSVSRQYYNTKMRRTFKDAKKIIENFQSLNLNTIQKINRDLNNYKNNERDYKTIGQRLTMSNNNINELRKKLGIMEE